MKTIKNCGVAGAVTASTAVITLLTGAVAPADATCKAPATCASGYWQDIYYKTSGSDTVLLQYNSNCKRLRAYLDAWLEPPGWEIWVYNKNTGVATSAYFPNLITTSIDAGAFSHACVQESGYPKACTEYFLRTEPAVIAPSDEPEW